MLQMLCNAGEHIAVQCDSVQYSAMLGKKYSCQGANGPFFNLINLFFFKALMLPSIEVYISKGTFIRF